MEVRVDTAASDGYPRFDVPRYYGDRWEFNRHEGGKTVRITLHRAGMEEFTGTVDGAPYRWVRLDQNPDASVTPIPRQADEEKAAPPDEAAWKAAERKQKRKEFDDFMNLTVDDL